MNSKWKDIEWPRRELAAIERKSTRQVRVALQRYHTQLLLDIREWSRGTPNDDQWYPERKGISLRRSDIPTVIEALQRAEREFDDFSQEPVRTRAA